MTRDPLTDLLWSCFLVCAATYNNIGLAASAIGQIDLAFRCFQFGLKVAEDDEEIEMIWYNIGNVAMQIGEFQLARRCYKISVAAGDGGMALNRHQVVYNNMLLLDDCLLL